MQLSVIAIGKNSSDSLKKLERLYLKRISYYLNLELVEVDNVKKTDNLKKSDVIKSEADKLIKRIPKNSYKICLSEEGKHFTSEIFAKYLKKLLLYKNEPVYFIIGGPFGLGKKVKSNSHKILSLSHFTFPHQLSRIILLEQIYRAMTIIKGKNYHY